MATGVKRVQQEQKKELELMQERFDHLETMLAEITRRLPKGVTEEQDEPTPTGDTGDTEGDQVDGADLKDKTDTHSWDVKWSDSDDNDDESAWSDE